jgi:hypothetical protein
VGDVFIKLSADEKQAVDAIMKVVEAQKKGGDAANKHKESWNKMSSEAQSAANTMTGGLASTLTGVGAISEAVGKLKELWAAWTEEAKKAAEEFKKQTEEIAAAVAGLGKTADMGQVRLQLANMDMYGMDMSQRTKMYKAVGGDMEALKVAGQAGLAGMNDEQALEFATSLRSVKKVAGDEMNYNQIADLLMGAKRKGISFGAEDVGLLKQMKESGAVGTTQEALENLMVAKKAGVNEKALGGIIEFALGVKPQEKGSLSQESKDWIAGKETIIKNIDAQEESLRQTKFDATQKHDAERLASDAAMARAPKWQKEQLKAELDTKDEAWRTQELQWKQQEETMRRQKGAAENDIAEEKRKMVFTPEQQRLNELAGMSVADRFKAITTERQYAEVAPGTAKIEAMQSIDRGAIRKELAGSAGSYRQQQLDAMGDKNYAAVMEAKNMVAVGDIDYEKGNQDRKRDYQLYRGVIAKLAAEDGTKYKRDTMYKELDAAYGAGVDLSRLDIGISGRAAQEFAAARIKAGAGGMLVGLHGSAPAAPVQPAAGGPNVSAEPAKVEVTNQPQKRVLPSRNGGNE